MERYLHSQIIEGLGFRTFHDMNMALLAKMGWHLANHSNKKWVRLVLSKYCSHRRFINITPKSFNLYVWKGISGSLQALKRWLYFQVGNEENKHLDWSLDTIYWWFQAFIIPKLFGDKT